MFRRAIAVQAIWANFSGRKRRTPASVIQENAGMQPERGAVAAYITPVFTTAPVMILVQIAMRAWSPMIAPRKVSPVRSIGPVGVARAATSEYVFRRLEFVVPAPRLTHSPMKESPRWPSWALLE